MATKAPRAKAAKSGKGAAKPAARATAPAKRAAAQPSPAPRPTVATPLPASARPTAPARMPPPPPPAPAWTAAPPPPPVVRPRPVAGVAKALSILLIVSLAFGVLSTSLLFAGLPTAAAAALGFVSFAIAVPTIVVFCIWLHRTLSNARDRYPEAGIKAGWAVGSFFIPFVNLVAPYLEVRRAWAADVRRGEALPAVWFGAWSLGQVVAAAMAIAGLVASFGILFDTDAEPGTAEYRQVQDDAEEAQREAQQPFLLPAQVLNLVAGIALILVVRQWSAWQDPAPAS